MARKYLTGETARRRGRLTPHEQSRPLYELSYVQWFHYKPGDCASDVFSAHALSCFLITLMVRSALALLVTLFVSGSTEAFETAVLANANRQFLCCFFALAVRWRSVAQSCVTEIRALY